MRHINIPVFIPHLGCPNDCVFCNQRIISGKKCFDAGAVRNEIESSLSTAEDATVQIAFFGGSFTGIPRDEMISLLEIADEYIKQKRVDSVRLSTRPDYIDGEILDILERYHVRTIELGIQSMSKTVLSLCKRGHSVRDTENACRAVLSHGFELVGQMMIGLPGSSAADEVYTAEMICSLGAGAARIYPTVVLRGTELENMFLRGDYSPPSPSEFVSRSADAFEVFLAHGVEVIRIGLVETGDLSKDRTAGAADPSVGEAVRSEIYRRRIVSEIGNADLSGKELTVFCPPGEVGATVGLRGSNKNYILDEYNVKRVKVVEKRDILGYNVKIAY